MIFSKLFSKVKVQCDFGLRFICKEKRGHIHFFLNIIRALPKIRKIRKCSSSRLCLLVVVEVVVLFVVVVVRCVT
jgi:hypothetical protein